MITEYIQNICKIGQAELCCKYLIMGSKGFECAKKTSMKEVVDDNWANNEHVAQGDNCEGLETFEKLN